MSAVLSFETPEAVYIITDGAFYEGDILTRVDRKIAYSSIVPIAVATRGHSGVGEYVAKLVIDAVEKYGFDAAIAVLAEQLYKFRNDNRASRVEATIAGISEKYGPRRLVFRSDKDPVVFRHDGFSSSCATADAVPSEMGIRARAQIEPWGAFLKDVAVPMMQFFREVVVKEGRDRPAHIVGGQVDFTILNSSGVIVETIHRWDDKIGERIDPFRERKTVQAFPGLSRQQRRAADRLKRKAG